MERLFIALFLALCGLIFSIGLSDYAIRFSKKCAADVKLSENVDVLANVRLVAMEEKLERVAAALETLKRQEPKKK